MLLLTREREARGWSRNELARRARMAGGDVGRIEAGRLHPYESQLKKLAKALGWPIDEAQRLLDVLDGVEGFKGPSHSLEAEPRGGRAVNQAAHA